MGKKRISHTDIRSGSKEPLETVYDFKMPRRKRTKSSHIEDRRTGRVLSKLFPGFNRLGPQLAQTLDEFDPATPRSTLEKGRELLTTYVSFDSVRGRLLARLIKLGLRSAAFRNYTRTQLDGVIRIAKKEAARDPRYALLLKLMHEVDKIAPFGSSIVVHRHADPEKSFLKQMDPLPEFEAASRCFGERRFNHAREAFRRTVEHLYDPYVRTLIYLGHIREGKKPSELGHIAGMKFGVAVAYLQAKLPDYAGLFETRSSWFRNAVTHGIPDYDLATDRMVLTDGSRSAVISTDELLALSHSLYEISGKTIVFVSQLYLFREVFRDTGLFDLYIDYVPQIALEADPQRALSIEERFIKEVEKVFGQKLNADRKA